MAGEFVDAPAPAAPPAAGGGEFVDAPGPNSNPISAVTNWAKNNIARPVGGAIQYGHAHPVTALMNVLGAPQRGLQAAETGGDVGKAIMTPSEGSKLTKAFKTKIGLQGLEDGPLAGGDLGHKMARSALNTGLDVVNDPLTFAPVGKIVRLGGKLVPGAAKGVQAATDAFKESKLGKALDPEADFEGLTDKGKATFQAIQNGTKQALKAIQEKEESVVRKYADAIRSGQMPAEVATLFRDVKNVPGAARGMRPQDVVSALARDRKPLLKEAQNRMLRNAGLLRSTKLSKAELAAIKDPKTRALKIAQRNLKPNPSAGLFQDYSRAEETQKALGKVVNPGPQGRPNFAIDLARKATRLGNKAFLANPVPHTLNLTSLAYNKYGAPTAIKGLVNAARIATGTTGKGKLAQNIGELQKTGAKSEYSNIFDEMGLTGSTHLPGSRAAAKIANKALIPAQRFSNFAQHKILNSTETGLRAAALDAEKAGGKQGVEAARNIHKTFGTGPKSAAIRDIGDLGTPFAEFHLSTAPASGLSALANHPGRVTNAMKAQRDMNSEVNPGGPEYRSSVPGLSVARVLADPLSYFSNLGPISALQSPYGVPSQLKKGASGVANVAGDVATQFVPGAQQMLAIKQLIEQKHGKMGEQAMSDLIASLIGGYYAKK